MSHLMDPRWSADDHQPSRVQKQRMTFRIRRVTGQAFEALALVRPSDVAAGLQTRPLSAPSPYDPGFRLRASEPEDAGHGSVDVRGRCCGFSTAAALLAGERTEVNDLVEFVDDFTTENLFEHILKGHDTTHTAELVGDHY